MITNFLLFLASVIIISLSGVMMPGSVFAVTIAKGYKNKNAGAIIALGHGIIEFPLIFLIYFGFSQLFTSNIVKTFIGLIGGIMLAYMGLSMLKIIKRIKEEKKDLSYNSLIGGILTTVTNPYFFLWWATFGATLIINASIFGIIGLLSFAIIHWSCDFVWDLFVSKTVFKTKHLWSEKIYKIVFGSCGVILILFGIWFIISSI